MEHSLLIEIPGGTVQSRKVIKFVICGYYPPYAYLVPILSMPFGTALASAASNYIRVMESVNVFRGTFFIHLLPVKCLQRLGDLSKKYCLSSASCFPTPNSAFVIEKTPSTDIP
jgi:hypothetical protein